ncbi:MAG: putative heme transporter [Thermoleophilaceae bacterium]|nr:putative heme transporter [Thermoleophilaceae bacterium]MEA2389714.1 putative heme transporter [Thermoleophilaceae bacterium]
MSEGGNTRERDTFEESVEEVRELMASADLEEDAEDIESRGAALLGNRRQVISLALAVILMVIAIYVVFPKVVGVGDAVGELDEATWYWLVIALGFNVVRFLAYSSLFRGVLSGEGDDEVNRRLDFRASYQITMAGFAATILFSAAGAGGVALTYWALRKAGMERRRAACRMVAFMVLLYTVYLASLLIFGVLLRVGVLSGERPIAGTIVPAAIAGGALVILGFVALLPGDFERRMAAFRRRRKLRALATGPATLATGVRTALTYIRHPTRSASAIVGAVGWWAGNIGILWASFHAFHVGVPLGVVVQGYFLGMVANLAPSPAAGVGTVDAGLIGAFVLFGIPAVTVFPAILIFRLIAFWLPIPLGVWAYVQLRRTIHRWSEEPAGATIKSEVTAKAT